MAHGIWRALVVAHRYLGVAVGLLMLMWFLSGIVMMYVGFPQLTETQRLRALVPISWQDCCRFGDAIADDAVIARAQVEMLAGTPVLRLRRAGRLDTALDLARGVTMRIDADEARAIALDAAPRIVGGHAELVTADLVTSDQWTVGHLFRDRPLHRFAFADAARTTVYVSGTTGHVVLWTTGTQRFWNWLGAVPHWLYVEVLRSNARLWSEVVIWTSLLGSFLTAMGLAIGIVQIRRGAFSPYRGLFYWHHLAGLVFGIAALGFVFSGLVSMNPWGFLEGRRGGGEQARLEGTPPTWGEVKASLARLLAQPEAVDAVSLVSAPLAGRLYWLARSGDGTVRRIDAAGHAAPLTDSDLAQAVERLAPGSAIATRGLLTEEDAYYFRHGDDGALPVYRVIIADAEATRYYLDPVSGVLLGRADADGRWHRWLFAALHRWDFAAPLRARPLWDAVMLTLMLGGTVVTATGCWLALLRIRSDVASLFRSVRRTR